jgi:hypothetical protein
MMEARISIASPHFLVEPRTALNERRSRSTRVDTYPSASDGQNPAEPPDRQPAARRWRVRSGAGRRLYGNDFGAGGKTPPRRSAGCARRRSRRQRDLRVRTVKPDGRAQDPAGELDEIAVFIAPVLLGDGVRLFAHPGGATVELERISLTEALKASGLRFRVLR